MGIVVYSGGFDPLHADHIERIQEAAEFGNLIVIIEPDSFVEKKHPVLLPQADRAAIVSAIAGVKTVMLASDEVPTSSLLAAIRPEIYFVGPDHADGNFPENEVCQKYGIEVQVFDRLQHPALSSTKILDNYYQSRLFSEAAKNGPQGSKYNNPPVTVSAIIRSNRRAGVLVGKRRDNGASDLIGGFLEEHETLEDCLYREMREEIGAGPVGERYFRSMNSTYHDGRPILCVYMTCSIDKMLWFPENSEIAEAAWVTSVPGDMHSEADQRALEIYFRNDRE